MSANPRNLWRRAAASAGVVTLALVGGLVAAQPAMSASPVDITGTEGEIIVHKRTQPAATGVNHTGEVVGSPPGNALPDVNFAVYRLSTAGPTAIDLTTPAGWATFQAIQPFAANPTLDNPTAPTQVTINSIVYPVTQVGSTQTTSTPNGTATFPNLPLGIYLVVETGALPSAGVVTPAAPFIVSVPTAIPTSSSWNYSVNVYPKNVTTGITKSANQGGAVVNLGDEVEWTVTAQVPHLAPADNFTHFRIQDVLGANLTYLSTTSMTVSGPGTFTLGTHYTIVESPAGTINLTFTGPDGLDELKDEAGGETVTWVIRTRVTGIPTTGVLSNNAQLFINDASTEVSEDDENSLFGSLRIFKYAMSNGTPVGLENAVFHLYRDAGATTDRVSIAGTPWVGTSDINGIIDIPVLKPGTYYLLEVTAPNGYTPLPSPVEVVVVAGEWTVPSPVTDNTSLTDNYHAILNTQRSGWNLPLTGGSGTALLILIGSGLVLIAGGAALVNHRRRGRATQA